MNSAEREVRNDERAGDPIQLLAEHCRRLPSFTINLDAGTAYILLGTIQLALRHPGNTGRPAEIMRGLADTLIEILAAGDPRIEAILRMGDDPTCDVPVADFHQEHGGREGCKPPN